VKLCNLKRDPTEGNCTTGGCHNYNLQKIIHFELKITDTDFLNWS